MKFSKREVNALKEIIKKIENANKQEKIRVSARRISQLKGKTINKIIQKKKKPIRHIEDKPKREPLFDDFELIMLNPKLKPKTTIQKTIS